MTLTHAMIDPKELRIGNTIQWLHEESATEVTVDSRVIQLLSKYQEDPDADEFARGIWYAPIPITPEVLKRFGWAMEGYDGHPFIEAFSPGMGQRFDLWWMNGILHCKSRYQSEDGSPIEMRHIKSLHQLQNLYFSLTGKELEGASK